MKKAIAMRCTQEQFNSIKNKLKKAGCKIVDLDKFSEFVYLTNKFGEEQNTISNLHSSQDKLRTRWEIHETFNAKIFLDACGIDCDLYEITKEQLQTIEADGCIYVKQWFPDAFKKELEVGKWYKHPSFGEFLICITNLDKNKAYGFDFYGKYFNETTFGFSKIIEATPQEVEAALILEWEKLGGKTGVRVITPKNNCEHIIKNSTVSFDKNHNMLFMGSILIFYNGKFATIIKSEKMTLEQIEKELGRKIQII